MNATHWWSVGIGAAVLIGLVAWALCASSKRREIAELKLAWRKLHADETAPGRDYGCGIVRGRLYDAADYPGPVAPHTLVVGEPEKDPPAYHPLRTRHADAAEIRREHLARVAPLLGPDCRGGLR
jgi:hypothetical protein